MKRFTLIIGILLLIAGGAVVSGVVSYPENKTLISVGDASISVEDSKKVPPNIGYLLLLAGGVASAAALAMRGR